MSDSNSGGSAKKSYCRPAYNLKSIEEIRALLIKKVSDQANALGRNEVPVGDRLYPLVIEGYEGDLNFLLQRKRSPAAHSSPVSIMKGGGVVEMQFADVQDSAFPQTFLVLDLRYHGHGERGLLESVGGIPELHLTLPLIILVTSIEQFHGWRKIDATQYWLLQAGPSREELAAVLRWFLGLCAKQVDPGPIYGRK